VLPIQARVVRQVSQSRGLIPFSILRSVDKVIHSGILDCVKGTGKRACLNNEYSTLPVHTNLARHQIHIAEPEGRQDFQEREGVNEEHDNQKIG